MEERMEDNQKSIFSKRTEGGGRRCLSLSLGQQPKRNAMCNNGRFNIREIAERVKTHGSVDFEFEEEDLECIKPPRPFRRRFGRSDADCYDIRDANSPQEKTTDDPSADFNRCVRLVTGYPVRPDALQLVTEDGGVRKRILKEGTGALDQVTDGCRVWIHYETYRDNTPDQTLILLDSTIDHEMAASLQVGKEGIPGLQFGLKTMRVGEVAEFAISPVYAYGENGIVGFVAKNQHLRMVVELREVKHNHRKPMAFMTLEEKQTTAISLDEVVKEVNELIRAANAKFGNGLYKDACDRYNWALELLRDHHQLTTRDKTSLSDKSNSDARILIEEKSYQIYSNLALCLLRLQDYEEAEKACQSALRLHHQRTDLRPKVLYRLASALFKQDKFHGAICTCVRALASTLWGHTEFRDLKYKAENALERRQTQEKMEGYQGSNDTSRTQESDDSDDEETDE